MLNIAIFGPPGAGKGTQSELLIKKYNLTYISTGDLLRQEIAAGTDLGLEVKDIIHQGGLVSDEIIINLIEKKLTENIESTGFLFDGFPRTLVQAYILDGLLLKLNTSLSCMLSLDVGNDELIRRLLDRAKKSGRADDTLDVIHNRLKEYEEKTAPVKTYYQERHLYFPINGDQKIETVFEDLNEAIQQTIQRKWFNLVLLGAPGSGKGTQGNLLAKKFNLHYISTGSLLRKEVKSGSEIGKRVEALINRGDLVPDEIVIQLLEQAIKQQSNASGFVFKGFPRTVLQSYILDALLRRMEMNVSYVIEMNVPILDLIRRLDARGKSEKGRMYDQSTELILHRLELYQNKTKKVIEMYQKQNKFDEINGVGTPEEVFQRLSIVVERELKKAR